MIAYDLHAHPALLAREPPRSFPFLTDGDALYLVEGWRADAPPRSRLKVRRLSRRERALVEESLRDASEEARYRLEPALSARARRAPRGRS